jgi:hypothetical protein
VTDPIEPIQTPPNLMRSPIEDIMFAQLALLPAGKSIDPAAVAKALDPEGWRRALGQVRATAIGLARQGKLEITRHGKTADPGAFKGVYRLRLPSQAD